MMNKRNPKENLEFKALELLNSISRKDIKAIYKELNTSEDGLTQGEVENRFDTVGHNYVNSTKKVPAIIQFLKTFLNPFTLILLALVMVSFFTDVVLAAPGEASYETIIIIMTIVILSSVINFVQEYKSTLAAEKLKELIKTSTAVVREGKAAVEVDMADIVPGDIIRLSAGDMIPADLRIIECKDLFVSQSSLTGESEPIEKQSDACISNGSKSIGELNNICLLGTNVVSGTAKAVVIATGSDTYFGVMAKEMVSHKSKSSFETGINDVSMLLIRFMLIMVPIVFVVNGISKGNWLEALLFAISVAVGLTPEMLPMIVTTNLAKGAIALSKKKTIVKNLSSIQNFGSMDILCTDKTGTLTRDKIIVERHLDIHGNDDDRILRHAYLNSHYQTGLRNLMDIAILEFGDEKGFNDLQTKYIKVDEIPFDFTRRRMSVVLQDHEGKRQLITKGAIEEMLSICSFAEYRGNIVPLTPDVKEEVIAMVSSLNEEGMRVIGVAQKNDIPDENNFGVKDESDMVLMGYIGFLDPPKESAALAISALKKHGVDVKILTGDNEIVTKKICGEVGLEVNHIILGTELENMSDKELALEAERTTVFAKLSPMEKSRIIRVLKENGHTVGYMGDGINDAIALNDADVGISVDTAVDIAKESADIILLEKDLMVLENGVLEGRNTFGNIIKYIKMTASSNFGNVFSVLVASICLPFLPMLPIHLLTQNLLYNISQVSIPWDRMDPEYLEKPRKWNSKEIGKFMLFIGPISSIFDIATYILMWYVFKANSVDMQGLFQSGWFIEGLLSQTLIIHMIRTRKIPFIQSRAATPVLILTTIIMIVGIGIPFTTFGASIGLEALPLSYFPFLIVILLAYCFLTQFIKMKYIKKFNSWL
ncbi:magnesium-translocating P-type ATPase [Clostridium frigidicarnis]|uniref:Magnesium-transporting ATPase, P-type 1 n=1 Tax=Clostridium frigidicarnis TaxID=84698 RepID=A0A1I0Z8M8_9CLOT|nr:magnesium-translocating P-type ATPase [Clostridium frigidicarnis]SFB20930.1 Mg2+-importing ATPase [Clostridium frigidicarnis]